MLDQEHERRCSTCRFFHDRLTSVHEIFTLADEPCRAGECRAAPPRLQTDEMDPGWRIWPAVWTDDWCGAWAPDVDGQ